MKAKASERLQFLLEVTERERRHLLETPASALDNLNRMEKLGLVPSVDDWMEARNLRNRLIHEYQHEPSEFAAALNRASELVELLAETSERISQYTGSHFRLRTGG